MSATPVTQDHFFSINATQGNVPHPTLGGHLATKVMFDCNAFSFNCITRDTKAGICAVCGGLLVLRHHVVALCYWWPEGLKDSQVIFIDKTFLEIENPQAILDPKTTLRLETFGPRYPKTLRLHS